MNSASSAIKLGTSAASGLLGWVLNDIPVALVGVKMSVIVMAFSGVMLALSVMPAPDDQAHGWSLPFFLTVGSSALVNLALKHEGLDKSYSLGMGFLLGLLLTSAAVLVGRNYNAFVGALVERIRGWSKPSERRKP